MEFINPRSQGDICWLESLSLYTDYPLFLCPRGPYSGAAPTQISSINPRRVYSELEEDGEHMVAGYPLHHGGGDIAPVLLGAALPMLFRDVPPLARLTFQDR